MTPRDLSPFLRRLNNHCAQALSDAASLCETRAHRAIDIEHWLIKLLELGDGDLVAIVRRYELDMDTIWNGLLSAIDRLPHALRGKPELSPRLGELLQAAWVRASLEDPSGTIRSAHLLAVLAETPHLLHAPGAWPLLSVSATQIERLLPELDQVSVEATAATIISGHVPTAKSGDSVPAPLPASASTPRPALPGQADTSVLQRFTIDITQKARDGKIDPVFGRDVEIRQMVDILARRRKNNPILVGEPGVGKTALVEGLALKIAEGDVSEVIRDVTLLTLDLGLLQAGAGVKGEFEQRLKNVIEAVQQSPTPILLFIDEAHTLIGAGNTAGGADAANLLKPALARGELRTIAATTWSEYKQYFERDAALARRFQVIKVEEPDEATACAMLRAMAPLMEQHFGVRVYDDAIEAAVKLSHRYISGRQLPDKAISVLDTACAKVALGQSATPALVETQQRSIERIDAQVAALLREQAGGFDHAARLAELAAQHAQATDALGVARQRWEQEKAINNDIQQLRAAIDGGGADAGTGQPGALRGMLARLRELQGESPLVPVQVDGHVVAEIVAGWTGIPLGRMVKDEIRTVLNLQGQLAERIVGQDHALAVVAQRVRTARANLDDPNKPKGVFLFVGTSGVGKTETALALADLLYGGERKLVTINMSEYQEAHSVSGLKGSPPGYVGFGEGGVLTEAVRRNPYSVVLLDEVEKAHPDVLELFFQVFDKGVLDDAEGRQIDFKNTIIILTSNAASSQMMAACLNKTAAEQLTETIRPQLMKHFKPAFLGRLTVVPFYPINDAVLLRIIRLKLERIAARVAQNHQARFEFDEALVNAVLARCTEVDSGARNVDAILNGTLLPEIADSVLAAMAEGGAIARIKCGATKGGKFKYAIEAAS